MVSCGCGRHHVMAGEAEDDPAEVDGFSDIPPPHHRLGQIAPLLRGEFPQSVAKLLARDVAASPGLFRRAVDSVDRVFQPLLNEMVRLDRVYPQILDHQFENQFRFPS